MDVELHLLLDERVQSVFAWELGLVPSNDSHLLVYVLESDPQEGVYLFEKLGELDQNVLHGLELKVLVTGIVVVDILQTSHEELQIELIDLHRR